MSITQRRQRRGSGRLTGVVALASASALAAVGAIAIMPTGAAWAAGPVTFDFVGASVQTLTVPANVAAVRFEAAGGGGGYNAISSSGGDSEGALVTGTFPVEEGDELLISVAEAGTPAGGNPNGGSPGSGAGGWGGLGASGGEGIGSSDHLRSAGGGGGASTIQRVSGATTTTIVIAGGGGGDGGASGDPDHAGKGGSAGAGGSWTGADGTHGTEGDLGGGGGTAGAASGSQGAAGIGGTGDGGNGGGGGGGLHGGGGGGGAKDVSAGGGGGAGSSMVDASVTDAAITTSGTNWNSTVPNYPNGWVTVTLVFKPTPSMQLAVENPVVPEGQSIGALAVTMPIDAVGDIDFTDITDPGNPVVLGSATLVNGGAVLDPINQPLVGIGVHTIQASFPGDTVYASTSVTATATLTAVDLALGRPVTASSSLEGEGWGAQQLTDGATTSQLGHFGFTTDPAVPSADSDAWVVVDLGSPQTIGGIVLAPRSTTSEDPGDVDGAGFPVDFSVDVSDDGVTWTTVQAYTGQRGDLGPRTYVLPTPGTGQYLRVFVTELGPEAIGDDGFRLQLAGLQAYTQVPPATPVSLLLEVDATDASIPFVTVEGVDVYGTPTGEFLNCAVALVSSVDLDVVAQGPDCSGWFVELSTFTGEERTFTATLIADADVTGAVDYLPGPTIDTTVAAVADGVRSDGIAVVHVDVTESIGPQVVAAAAAAAPRGVVRILGDGGELVRGTLAAGAADLAFDARRLSPGRHVLRVEYLGSDVHRASFATVTITVPAVALAGTGSSVPVAGAAVGAALVLAGLGSVVVHAWRRRASSARA